MNIVDLVFAQADSAATALICDSKALTYGELDQAVDRASALLLKAGLPRRAPGFVPRIGLACPNGIDHIVLALAVLRTGGCLVPIAGELAVPEREALSRTVGVHAVIIAGCMPWPERLADPECSILVQELEAALCIEPPAESFNAPGFSETALAELNPALIRFSSGTTGRAKGVVLSHATLLARIETGNRRLEITRDDRVIWILPMAHHFAVSIMLYLLKGATTVIVRSHLAEDILDAAVRHRGTVLYGAPFHHALLAAESSGRQWPTLRLAVSTAAALPITTARAFDARYGVPLSQALGIIEIGLPFLNTFAPREKPDSIGRPLDDISFEIRDVEAGHPVPAGEVGELLVNAEGMIDAYLHPWQPRKDLLKEGRWFCTGDLARLDEAGCLYHTGRTKTVINVAGMKCFPEEVEAVLQSHPGVRAVCVSGRVHPQFGAVPVAEIIPAEPPPSIASLQEHCRASLARYKVPVEFRFVHDFARTPSGKIRRV